MEWKNGRLYCATIYKKKFKGGFLTEFGHIHVLIRDKVLPRTNFISNSHALPDGHTRLHVAYCGVVDRAVV